MKTQRLISLLLALAVVIGLAASLAYRGPAHKHHKTPVTFSERFGSWLCDDKACMPTPDGIIKLNPPKGEKI